MRNFRPPWTEKSAIIEKERSLSAHRRAEQLPEKSKK
jgi:hypothetical protein